MCASTRGFESHLLRQVAAKSKTKQDEDLKKLKQEIAHFQSLRLARKILVKPSIPRSLEELQTYILHSHLEVEKLMAEMIRVKIWAIVYTKENPQPSLRILAALMQLVDYVPYRRKNEILCKLETLFKPLSSRINTADKIRNIFAHTELSELLDEYDEGTVKGARKILDGYKFFYDLINEMVNTAKQVGEYDMYIDFIRGLISLVKK